MQGFKIIHKDETASTNADLKELAKNGAEAGTVIIAGHQTSGRGRLGRSFFSDNGGLYMSLLLELNDSPSAGLLTTFAAVAAARAIEKLARVKIDVKWVNDLLCGSKKICGILTEGVFADGRQLAVVGIGVNLTSKLPDELSQIAATLYEVSGQAVEPLDLAQEILDEFKSFDGKNPDEHLDEYRHRCVTVGKNVTVIPHQSPTYEAKALKITDNGGLLIKRADNGEEAELFFGEVSIRPTEGI